MIIGLPHETISDYIATARYISDSGASGIKISLLHILKDTDLYNDYCKDYSKLLPWMNTHLGTVEGGAGDGLDRSEADLVDELVHLLDGAGAYGVDEGEGVGADRHDDAALLGLAQAVVVALQLLLDQGALVLVVQLGDVDGRIGGVPGGQESDRRG